MNSNIKYDAIVIGSGISGGWAAKELTRLGLKTLMIERGSEVVHQKDYPGESIPSWDQPYRGKVNAKTVDSDYYIQNKCYAFKDANKQFFVKDSEHPYTTPENLPFYWFRGYQTGGRSLLWGRQCYRWSDLDFQANQRDGHGNDWPIRYKDIEKWYSYAEQFAGISGSRDNIPQLPDGVFQPPFDMNCVEEIVKKRIEEKYSDRKLIIGRVANLTQPTEEQISLGRTHCRARNECEKGCSFGAYFSTQSATLPAAMKTGLLTVLSDSIVTNIEYDETINRATAVNVIDRHTKETRQYHAKIIFLCASTLGSAQILLNSRSTAFPTGLGNSSGVLGHYLMDHIGDAGAIGVFPGELDKYYYGRRPIGVYVPRFKNVEKQDSEFIRGYAFQGNAWRESWNNFNKFDGIGLKLKKAIHDGGQWKFRLKGSGEMLPRFENHVRLHPTETDSWGIPLLVIHCEIGENENKMLDDMAETAAQMLEDAGLKEVQKRRRKWVPGPEIHEMGTARMGNDPDNSFLNSYNQSHDVPNLFITDGSGMCSTACQNPSLTYMALTARAAQYAVDSLKNGII